MTVQRVYNRGLIMQIGRMAQFKTTQELDKERPIYVMKEILDLTYGQPDYDGKRAKHLTVRYVSQHGKTRDVLYICHETDQYLEMVKSIPVVLATEPELPDESYTVLNYMAN